MRSLFCPSAALVVSAALASVARAADAQATAIRNVTVIDVATGVRLRERTIVIEGDRISALGATGSVRVPRGARVIDGAGKYIIPGLWDMHVHLGMAGASALPLLVANGVLGVRDMGDSFTRVKAWRDSIATGSLLGPRIEMVGPILENASWLTTVTRMLSQQGDSETARTLGERIAVATPDEARAAVERIATLGASSIKVRNDPPTAAYYALLREARRRGMRVVGHPPERGPTLADASDSGQASIEHLILRYREQTWTSALDAMSRDERAALFTRLARNRTALVPTIIAGIGFRRMPDSVVLAIIDDTTSTRDPRRRYVSASLAAQWRRQIEMKRLEGPQPDWAALNIQAAANLGGLDSAGVPILAGTDMGGPLVYPGFALHDELSLMVREGGMTPARALRAATLGPAQFFGLEKEIGAVATGMRADLVLLTADPLAAITSVGRIDSVILGGRVLDRAALDRILREVAASR
ncbi:MAG: amidohydrolase family protein [Gemmatimonadaceae bacterium]